MSVAAGCSSSSNSSVGRPASATRNVFVPANDPAFRFEGRVDSREPANTVLIWQGTRVAVDFEGNILALCFGVGKGVCFFDLDVDGERSVVEIKESAQPIRFKYLKPLTTGRHRLTLFKRSEADAGHVAFQGVELAAGAKVYASQPALNKLLLQFFGDSITAGACNEDGPEDQWETRSTHNNALSYAALTAKALQAGYRNNAVSGMGIVVGYVPKTAGEIWDRIYPEPSSPKADGRDWSPDVVFVNFGENDDSFSRNQNMEFPAGFTAGYVSLVKEMRRAFPQAEIVLLRGGMFGGAKSEVLRAAWEAAARQLESEDKQIHHYIFQHWSQTHPRVSDHQAMADELVAWLKTQTFTQRFL
ncbi:MAG: hypothetical protein IPP19_02905 [Verrucomicrobia bacterium]|nr:hypothetical protein [Verrucomicrobiota bacterium]